MAILTLPNVTDVANFSGRPEDSYTSYINVAIFMAVILFQTITELQPEDIAQLQQDKPEDYQLVQFGLQAMADFIYLRQPYQQIIASPLTDEHIGSYSYSKEAATLARQFQGMELAAETTGVVMYDLAVRALSKRTRFGGVFTGGITIFEEGSEDDQTMLMVRDSDNRLCILGPADRDQLNLPFDYNSEMFPADPGVG